MVDELSWKLLANNLIYKRIPPIFTILRNLIKSTQGKMRFGSCFTEVSLETRSYILSTGVNSRRTCGIPLKQIECGIQVAVDLHLTHLAHIAPLGQVHDWLHLAAVRATFGRWEKAVSRNHLTAIPLPLVGQLAAELIHTGIGDRLGQVMVLQHATHLQVFQHDD
jgi:hypothetical protein